MKTTTKLTRKLATETTPKEAALTTRKSKAKTNAKTKATKLITKTKKSENRKGQRQNGWAGAVMAGRGR